MSAVFTDGFCEQEIVSRILFQSTMYYCNSFRSFKKVVEKEMRKTEMELENDSGGAYVQSMNLGK